MNQFPFWYFPFLITNHIHSFNKDKKVIYWPKLPHWPTATFYFFILILYILILLNLHLDRLFFFFFLRNSLPTEGKDKQIFCWRRSLLNSRFYAIGLFHRKCGLPVQYTNSKSYLIVYLTLSTLQPCFSSSSKKLQQLHEQSKV